MQSEQPQVRVGQVWKDCDKHRIGERYLKVMRIIEPANDIAVCQRCFEDGKLMGGDTTKISIRRMKPGATGYRMVSDAK